MSTDSLLQDLQMDSLTYPVEHSCDVQLPVEDAARLAALAELYPQLSQEHILSLLLSHGLKQVNSLTGAQHQHL